MPCPNCASSKVEEIHNHCHHCLACNFIFVDKAERTRQQEAFIFNEIYSDNELNKLVNKYPKDKHGKRELYKRIASKSLKILKSNNIRAIDVGASGGFFLYELEKQGVNKNNLIALEMSPNYIALTDKYFGYANIRDNVENISSDNKYNLITLFDVLEHVSDFETSMHKMHDLLETDGLLYLKLPNGIFTRLKVRLAKIFKREDLVPKILYLEPGGHLNYWCLENINELEKFGYKIIYKRLVRPTLAQFGWKYPLYITLFLINDFLSTEYYPEFEVTMRRV